MKRSIHGVILVCALLAVACSGEERPPAEPAPVVPAEPAPPVAPAPPAEVPAGDLEPTAEEIPVREDFEAEVATQITAANYRAELDRLEKEIQSQN
jgi:hypothetical protein